MYLKALFSYWLMLLTTHSGYVVRKLRKCFFGFWIVTPEYIPAVGPKAFAMDSTNSPDIICGVLDHLSQSHPIKLWNQLAPALNFEEILHSCKHIGRFTVLLRIVERAVRQDGAGAVEIRDQLRRKISSPTEAADSAITKAGCPEWALIAEYQWAKLDAMGLATKELVERAKKVIKDECSPLEVDTYIEVERLLAEVSEIIWNTLWEGGWQRLVMHCKLHCSRLFPKSFSCVLNKYFDHTILFG